MAEAPSQVQQNDDWQCEDAVNTHIQLCLNASYLYMSMAVYCDRDEEAQENFKPFFLTKSHNCQTSAQMFMQLQNKRGGCIKLQDIPRPEDDSWNGGFQAMQCAFQMEMMINQSLLNMHAVAKEKGDSHLCDFLEQNCLDQQVDNLRQMEAVEQNLAEFLFRKLSLS